MDLVGPMGPEYPRKFFYVVVDRLTRFIWTKDYHGMPNSKDLINEIENLQTKYDNKCIHVIHIDQGSQFRSQYWKKELEKLQI
jgi:transposase InsO family protein